MKPIITGTMYGEVSFNVDVRRNRLLIKGEIPEDYDTFQILGKFIEALSMLNKDLEIVVLFDMKKVPFIFIMYLNKIQNTILLEEEKEMIFTIVSRDKKLKNFLDDFKESSNIMEQNGINPFKDILKTIGAGNTDIDIVNIPDEFKDIMPEDLQESISKMNEFNPLPDQDEDEINLTEKQVQDIQDLNIEQLNKIKFIYRD